MAFDDPLGGGRARTVGATFSVADRCHFWPRCAFMVAVCAVGTCLWTAGPSIVDYPMRLTLYTVS